MSETTTGTIIDGNGRDTKYPTVILEPEEALLLRNYKKFLLKYGLAEALRCKHCFENIGPAADGMDGRVTDSQIVFKCRHRLIFYQGS